MADYYTLLTDAGIAYETACKAAGTPIKLSQISVGDGGGAVYNPAATATALKREVWRGPLNALFQDENNPSWLLAEVTIPSDVGGWYVREAGIWTDTGILYAIVKYPESFKPILATSGSGKEFYIRSIFETSNAELVTLLIDDTVVKATRAWVASYVADELAKLDRKQSVRVATTANIVLSGAQTIDGVAVIAGDRVLVKSQTLAKDNGIYVAANGAWVRAKDADASVEVTSGLSVPVEEGATLANTFWQLITDGVIVLGTTALTFQDVTAGFARLLSPVFTGAPMCPTPTQFDGSKLLVNAEFVRRHGLQYSSFSSQSANYVMTLADIGGLVSFSNAGPLTCTLPATSSIPAATPAIITLANAGNGSLTISSAGGGDTVSTSTGVVGSIVIGLGDTAEFIRLGGQWRLIGGTVAIRYASVMDDPVFTTQPLFDNTPRIATDLFVQRALGNHNSAISITDAINLTALHCGAQLVGSIGLLGKTITLPPTSGLPTGATIHFSAGGSSTTIACANGDFVAPSPGGGGTISSFTIDALDSVVLVNLGTGWRMVGGSHLNKHSGQFSASLNGSGYQKLPSGLIIQWGGGLTSTGGVATIAFPITFPTGVTKAFVSASGTNSVPTVGVVASNSIGINCFSGNTGAGKAENVQFLAVGY